MIVEVIGYFQKERGEHRLCAAGQSLDVSPVLLSAPMQNRTLDDVK
jgi:hypothetical protein